MKRALFLLLACLALCGCVSYKGEDKRLYSIEIREAPTEIVRTAADELSHYLDKIFTRPIVLNGRECKVVFRFENVSANDVEMPEGFAIFAKDNVITFKCADKNDAGPYSYVGEDNSILAVFYFLRKYAGLRIYAPDEEHGETFACDVKLNVPAEDIPDFSYKVRGMGLWFDEYDNAQMERYSKKQLCVVPFWSIQDVYYQCLNKWNTRFADRPELFSLYDGKRVNESYPKHIPCLSNPEVKKIIVEDILRDIALRDAMPHSLRVFCDAPFRRCECPDCAGFNGSNDDYFYGFILDVFSEVRKRYPDMWCFLQEKSSSHCNPPVGRNLENVTVDISTGLPGRLNLEHWMPLFKAWSSQGARPLVRIYPRMPMWDSYPIINPHTLGRCYAKLQGVCWGQRRSDEIAYHAREKRHTPYSFVALTNFVYTNLLLDANQSVDALIEEFCNFMYPGAGREMMDFYAAMERIYDSGNILEDPLLTCYVSENMVEPDELLAKAEQKCTDKFWLDTLRKDFHVFLDYTHENDEIMLKCAEYRRDAEERRAKFRKDYPTDMKFTFSSKPLELPLCPVSKLAKAPFMEPKATVSIIDGRVNLKLETKEDCCDKLVSRIPFGGAGNVWQDDCFEIMLVPSDKIIPALQIIVNGNGALQLIRYEGEERKSCKEPRASEFVSSGKIKDNGWEANVSFPLSVLEDICNGMNGRFGIFKTRRLDIPDFYPEISGFCADLPDGNFSNVDAYRNFSIVP